MMANAIPIEQAKEAHRRTAAFDGQQVAWAERNKRLNAIDPLAWLDQPIPDRRWLVDGVIPWGNVSLISGDGGVGKSLLMLQLMACTSTGKPWLGIPTARVKSLGVFCEDDRDELHRRLADVARHYDIGFGDLEDMRLISRVGLANELMIFPKSDGDAGRLTKLYDDILSEAKEHGAQLIVLDTAADLFGGQENWRNQVRSFVGVLRKIALEIDGAVVLTSHPSVSGMSTGTGTSGSTAWNNSVRSRLYLTRPARPKDQPEEEEVDQNIRYLRGMKSNYGSMGGKVKLRWCNGAFESEGAMDGGMVEKINRQVIERAFLSELAALLDEGHEPSFRVEARTLYAPKLMHGRLGVKSYSAADLSRAMRDLMASGQVVMAESERGPKSRHKQIIVPKGHRLAGVEQVSDPLRTGTDTPAK